jgi:hypothetical protein
MSVGIRDIYNAIESTLGKLGFPLADTDEIPQGKKATIRVVDIPGDQILRGTIGGGSVRLNFGIEISVVYSIGTDKRIERKVAEDAEDIIAAIYRDVNTFNHQFVGATVVRDVAKQQVMNTMRFDFQSQVAL